MVLTSWALCLQGMIMGPKTAISMLVGAILGESHNCWTVFCSRIGTCQQHFNMSRTLTSIILFI